jgi:hypothetical protein
LTMGSSSERFWVALYVLIKSSFGVAANVSNFQLRRSFINFAASVVEQAPRRIGTQRHISAGLLTMQ